MELSWQEKLKKIVILLQEQYYIKVPVHRLDPVHVYPRVKK